MKESVPALAPTTPVKLLDFLMVMGQRAYHRILERRPCWFQQLQFFRRHLLQRRRLLTQVRLVQDGFDTVRT
jgi:hypothetical protein